MQAFLLGMPKAWDVAGSPAVVTLGPAYLDQRKRRGRNAGGEQQEEKVQHTSLLQCHCLDAVTNACLLVHIALRACMGICCICECLPHSLTCMSMLRSTHIHTAKAVSTIHTRSPSVSCMPHACSCAQTRVMPHMGVHSHTCPIKSGTLLASCPSPPALGCFCPKIVLVLPGQFFKPTHT